MNRILLSVAAVATTMMLFSTACKKKSNDNPNFLPGTWTVSAQANDDNHNNIEDASEIISLTGDTTTAHQLFKFNADGTLEFSYYSLIITGTWAYEHNNTYLKLVADSSDPSYSKIEKLTATSMTLIDTTGGTMSWTTFTKK